VTWAWLAWTPGESPQPENPLAGPVTVIGRAVLTSPDGRQLAELAAWPAGRKPVRQAVRVDAAGLDPEGEPGWVSLVLVPAGRAPLFDDPAVSGALRAVLAGPPPEVVTTFVRDSTHFAGAVTIRRGDPAALRDDPFARLGPQLVARVGGGLFGRTPPPAGPVIQRYAGQPWPAAGF